MNTWNSPTLARTGLSRRGDSYSWSGLAVMLHVCAYCRRVRGLDGAYSTMEATASGRLGASISHGICADCALTR